MTSPASPLSAEPEAVRLLREKYENDRATWPYMTVFMPNVAGVLRYIDAQAEEIAKLTRERDEARQLAKAAQLNFIDEGARVRRQAEQLAQMRRIERAAIAYVQGHHFEGDTNNLRAINAYTREFARREKELWDAVNARAALSAVPNEPEEEPR